jgi:hypothetical protein
MPSHRACSRQRRIENFRKAAYFRIAGSNSSNIFSLMVTKCRRSLGVDTGTYLASILNVSTKWISSLGIDIGCLHNLSIYGFLCNTATLYLEDVATISSWFANSNQLEFRFDFHLFNGEHGVNEFVVFDECKVRTRRT